MQKIQFDIPINKAKKIDNDQDAYGMLFYKMEQDKSILYGNKHDRVYYIQTPNTGDYKIDLLTLKTSFDGGKTWISPNVIKDVLKECETLVDICIKLEDLNNEK